MRTLFVLSLLVIAAVRPAAAAPDYAALNRALTDGAVIPAYRSLAETTAALRDASEARCDAASPATLEAAKAAFGRAMDAWQHAQPVSFGPVKTDSRDVRIEFWPDKRGTGTRQVRRALAAKQPDLVAPGGLKGKSVALQGLVTYERLLYDHADDAYACRFATAIARFQAEIAAAIVADWTKTGGYRETMLTAGGGNAQYADAKEAATDFLKSVATALDRMIDQKLERPLGDSRADSFGTRAESWRSGRSLENVAAGLDMLGLMFSTPGGFRDQLAAAGAGPLGDGMVRLFGEAAAAARAIPLPLSKAVADETVRPQVEKLLDDLQGLRTLVRNPVADELGIVIGFNSLDGD